VAVPGQDRLLEAARQESTGAGERAACRKERVLVAENEQYVPIEGPQLVVAESYGR
jgi:hypothetical protein